MSKAPDFSYTPEQVKNLSETAIKDLEARLKEIVSIPAAQRNFKNTMLAFETATSDFSEAVQVPIMLAYCSVRFLPPPRLTAYFSRLTSLPTSLWSSRSLRRCSRL